jgi:hypothetical protein
MQILKLPQKSLGRSSRNQMKKFNHEAPGAAFGRNQRNKEEEVF